LTNSRAVWATSRQPRAIVREWPRFGILTISVTAGLRARRLEAAFAIAQATVVLRANEQIGGQLMNSSRAVRRELVLEPPGSQPQSLHARTGNPSRRLPPLLLELAMRFAQPAPASVGTDLLRIEPAERPVIIALI